MTQFPTFPVQTMSWEWPRKGNPKKRRLFYKTREGHGTEFNYGGERYLIVVPEGFIYDGGSVPRLGFTISGLTPGGPILLAAIVHDFLYLHEGRLPSSFLMQFDLSTKGWKSSNRVFTRRQSDEIFRLLLKQTVDPEFPDTKAFRSLQIMIAYRAVRIGGRWSKRPTNAQ